MCTDNIFTLKNKNLWIRLLSEAMIKYVHSCAIITFLQWTLFLRRLVRSELNDAVNTINPCRAE